MKDKFNRAVATGLLALMIANFTACDSTIPGDTNFNNTTDINGGNYTTSDNLNNNQNNNNNNTQEIDLEGDVWKAVEARGLAKAEYFAGSNIYFEHLPIPVEFLIDRGLLYYSGSELCINGKQQTGILYTPLQSYAFIDENSDENDVYVLTQYVSDELSQDVIPNDTYLATWKLKYTLDDEDYNTLLKLQGDFRLRYFIQEMDKIYQPEVVSESIVTHNCVFMGSPFRLEPYPNNGFPRIYVHNVDYDTKTITYGTLTNQGIVYYNVNLYESDGWQHAQEWYGLTEEECHESIKISNIDTMLGPALRHFDVYTLSGGISIDRAKSEIENSTRKHELKDLGATSIYNNNLTR